jgi:DNA invertase Pin-like site-specific DNA recombinase
VFGKTRSWSGVWTGLAATSVIDTVNTLKGRGIHFRSLQGQFDTSTSGGKLTFHIFGVLAERDLIRERTKAGLMAARARGKVGGRPRVAALNTQQKVQMAKTLHTDKRNSFRISAGRLRSLGRRSTDT